MSAFSAGKRLTGKNAAIYSVLARTTVAAAAAMTDGGAHTVYTYQVAAADVKFWNPNLPPAITLQTAGAGPFNPVSSNLYTVDYINGTVTFLTANGATDVVKINSIEYMTLQNIGVMHEWSVDISIKTDDATAFADVWEQKLATFLSWKGAAAGYHVSSFWFDLATQYGNTTNPELYVAFYPQGAAGGTGVERFIGACTVDFGIDVKKDKTIAEKLTITGTGVLARSVA